MNLPHLKKLKARFESLKSRSSHLTRSCATFLFFARKQIFDKTIHIEKNAPPPAHSIVELMLNQVQALYFMSGMVIHHGKQINKQQLVKSGLYRSDKLGLGIFPRTLIPTFERFVASSNRDPGPSCRAEIQVFYWKVLLFSKLYHDALKYFSDTSGHFDVSEAKHVGALWCFIRT